MFFFILFFCFLFNFLFNQNYFNHLFKNLWKQQLRFILLNMYVFNLITFTKLCSFLATFFKVFMKKLILRNILSATLLTKWNLEVLFKNYAKTPVLTTPTFTTPVVTNFYWWLLLRIHLRLVVSNSSSLQQVPS